MSLYCASGGIEADLSSERLHDLLVESLAQLGERKRVLVVPPDHSRIHSRAGDLTRYAWKYYGERLRAVLPALGTHAAMQPEQIERMFGAVPIEFFHGHNWRTDVVTLGEVPAEFIYRQSEGKLNYAYPAQVNRLIAHGGFDLILSIGQVVPHEVIGMANYNKNILVGTGGRDGINRSHYLGAVYGMERIMGRAENPVRAVLNYAADLYLKIFPSCTCSRWSGERMTVALWCADFLSAMTSNAFTAQLL
jgi:nickel-dependent lactate racemase